MSDLEKLEKQLELIESRKQKIDEIVAESMTKEKMALALKEKLRGNLDRLINIDLILNAQKEMSRAHNINHFSTGREHFNKAQDMIRVERQKLKECGLKTVGISELCYMSFNRPARDVPSSVTLDDIYNVYSADDED